MKYKTYTDKKWILQTKMNTDFIASESVPYYTLKYESFLSKHSL